jgi:hypothetical protein
MIRQALHFAELTGIGYLWYNAASFPTGVIDLTPAVDENYPMGWQPRADSLDGFATLSWSGPMPKALYAFR